MLVHWTSESLESLYVLASPGIFSTFVILGRAAELTVMRLNLLEQTLKRGFNFQKAMDLGFRELC